MFYHSWLAVGAIFLAPLMASAQSNPLEKSTAGASTALPYQSAFDNYRAFAEGEETPDTRWRAANEEMGKLGGHAAHMKDNGTSPGQATPAKAAPKANAPIDHSKHH